MRTIKTNIYQFDELSETGKAKAVELLHDLNTMHDWFDPTYDYANQYDFKITGFDLGQGDSITTDFVYTAGNTAGLILKDHNKHECSLCTLARLFLAECEKFDDLEDLEETFRIDLGNAYLNILREDYESLTSEAAIIASIKANEYEFTEDGKLYAETVVERLEYLRAELQAERISLGELAELQSLAKYIDPSDAELLEAAGVPEQIESITDINGTIISVGDTVKTQQPQGGVMNPAPSQTGIVEEATDALGATALQIRYRKDGQDFDRHILLKGKINEIVPAV